MTIIINGRDMELPDGCTVADLIERLGLAGQPVALERNREVVPRAMHTKTILNDGDRIELVTLVGGG